MPLLPRFLSRRLPHNIKGMSRSAPNQPTGPSTSIEEFNRVLQNSTRVLALCGAGLSASSGLDTFRGAGGMWRNHRATSLATPEAFERDPGLVWLFYSYRRHRALQAAPNQGHYALTELSKKMPGLITITQNVDGLSQRANHPQHQLKLLHGSLFDIKCFNCDHIEHNNYDDPYHPLLAIDSSTDSRLATASTASTESSSSSSTTSNESINSSFTPTIPPSSLPHCPTCKTGLLRPGVVWFGELLSEPMLKEIEMWIQSAKVDLVLVIGTTATVYPAAGYVSEARAYGARAAVINMDVEDLGATGELGSEDFLFQGDSAVLLPQLFRSVIGDMNGIEN